jgi:hypothetical protein
MESGKKKIGTHQQHSHSFSYCFEMDAYHLRDLPPGWETFSFLFLGKTFPGGQEQTHKI